MSEDLKEIRKGAMSRLGEHLMTLIIAGVIALGGFVWLWGEKLWNWWQNFHFAPKTISTIEFWSITVVIILTVGLVLLYIFNLHEQIATLEISNRQKANASGLSTQPRSWTDSTGRHIERLSDLAFHVLKLFDRINPNAGGLTVLSVNQLCEISEADARKCVQELWNWKYIVTAIPGPGDWNGHYVITRAGKEYVRTFAT